MKNLASKEQWRLASKKFPLQNVPGLAKKATTSVKNILTKRFESLTYKEKDVKVGIPATSDQIYDLKQRLTAV